jgi:hypothetical protein
MKGKNQDSTLFRRGARIAVPALLLVFLMAAAGNAAPAFRVNKNYPATGLTFKALGNGGEPDPLPQPKTYTYTFTRGEESVKRDLFDPRELWYATQNVGQWHDKAGNQLILGRATRQLPQVTPLAGPHVAREDFDKAMADGASAFKTEDDTALSTWVASFSGAKPDNPQKLRPSFRLTDSLYFQTDDAGLLVYVFRVKTHSPDGRVVPSDWFCACVRIADGTEPAKVRKEFEAQFLGSVAALPRSVLVQSQHDSKELKTTGPGNRAKADIPDSPSRAAAKKSIANMQGWWYAETPDYIFLSDVRSSLGKNLVRTLQNTMPAYRKELARVIPPFKEITDANVVRIFEDEAEYKRAAGKEHEWSIGLWSPERRELTILCQGKEADGTLETIRHEGFHQYLFYATDMIINAMWYNEGHACFFETAKIDNRGRVAIPENKRSEQLDRELDRVTQLIPAVLRAGYTDFYSADKNRLQLNYTTAWALVYFLRKGIQTNKHYEKYAGILGTYRTKLYETKDCAAATEAAFEGLDMATFQTDFAEFWKKGRNAARRADPAPDKAE